MAKKWVVWYNRLIFLFLCFILRERAVRILVTSISSSSCISGIFGHLHSLSCLPNYCQSHWLAFASFVGSYDKGQVHLADGESIHRSGVQPQGLGRGLRSRTQMHRWEVKLSCRRKEAASLDCVCARAVKRRHMWTHTQNARRKFTMPRHLQTAIGEPSQPEYTAVTVLYRDLWALFHLGNMRHKD